MIVDKYNFLEVWDKVEKGEGYIIIRQGIKAKEILQGTQICDFIEVPKW